MKRLAELQSQRPQAIADYRGKGLLVGVEFTHEDIAGLVIAGLAQRGVIAAYTLNNPRVIRLEPPLVITEEQLDRAVALLTESLDQTMSLLEGLST
jgi:putrescine aminotransferase